MKREEKKKKLARRFYLYNAPISRSGINRWFGIMQPERSASCVTWRSRGDPPPRGDSSDAVNPRERTILARWFVAAACLGIPSSNSGEPVSWKRRTTRPASRQSDQMNIFFPGIRLSIVFSLLLAASRFGREFECQSKMKKLYTSWTGGCFGGWTFEQD